MMNRKTMYIILACLAIGGLMVMCGLDADAQTHPTWIGEVLTTGTMDVLTDGATPAPGPLSYIQVVESASWTGSFWGTSPVTGGLIRLIPMYGASTDTTIELVAGAGFAFPGVGVKEIRTTFGTATFWGE